MDKLDPIETEVRHVVSVMTGDGATVSVTITETDNSVESETEAPEAETEDAAPEGDVTELEAAPAEGDVEADGYGKKPGSRKGPTDRVFRVATFERASMLAGDRRVTLAFSSEAPVDRVFGVEVLDHGDGAINNSFIGCNQCCCQCLSWAHEYRFVESVLHQVLTSNLGKD